MSNYEEYESEKPNDPGAPVPGWIGSDDPLYLQAVQAKEAEMQQLMRQSFHIQKIANGWLISTAHPHSLMGHGSHSTHYVRCIEDISEKIAELHNAP